MRQNQDNFHAMKESDSHKHGLEQREKRKQKGKTKHSGKKKQDVKWYDHWD